MKFRGNLVPTSAPPTCRMKHERITSNSLSFYKKIQLFIPVFISKTPPNQPLCPDYTQNQGKHEVWLTHSAKKNFYFVTSNMIMYLISRRHFKAVDFNFPASLDIFSWRQNKAVFLLVSHTRREIKCPFPLLILPFPLPGKSTATHTLGIYFCWYNQHQELFGFVICTRFPFMHYVSKKKN